LPLSSASSHCNKPKPGIREPVHVKALESSTSPKIQKTFFLISKHKEPSIQKKNFASTENFSMLTI
jgi:hypothetical protein